jgi:hypothetical protein
MHFKMARAAGLTVPRIREREGTEEREGELEESCDGGADDAEEEVEEQRAETWTSREISIGYRKGGGEKRNTNLGSTSTAARDRSRRHFH